MASANPYLALLEAARRGEKDIAPITRLFGMRLLDFGEGTATLAMAAGPEHHNPLGIVHGGVFADLADAAFGCALATVLEPGATFGTVTLQLSYFRPVAEGEMTARARVVRRGRRIVHLECDVESGGELAARATSSYLVSSA